MCGVKTNVVTAVEIDERHGADATKFKPLMNATVKGFMVNEVSADSAYSELREHGGRRHSRGNPVHRVQG